MSKLNCWEFYNCGKEEGGKDVGMEGPCPASTFEAAHNFMGGINGGRACAYIAGTFCSETLEGEIKDIYKSPSPANRLKLCTDCDFYHHLRKEEQDRFSLYNFLLFVKTRLLSTNIQVGEIEVPRLGKIQGKQKQSAN